MIIGNNADSIGSPNILFQDSRESSIDLTFGFDIPKSDKMQNFPNSSRRQQDMPNTSQNFVKNEHTDQHNRLQQHSDFSGFTMNQNMHPNQTSFQPSSYGGGNFGNGGSIDPSALVMGQGQDFTNNQYGDGGFFGSSMIATEELLDLHTDFDAEFPNFLDLSGNNNNNNQQQAVQVPTNLNNGYSHTPDNAPFSPFMHPGSQFRQHMHQNSYTGLSSPQSFNTSPLVRSSSTDINPSSFEGYMNSPLKVKPKNRPEPGRRASSKISNSPKTPATALKGLTINTGDAQPIQNHHLNQHRQSKSISGTWDGTPSSFSYLDSPLASPQTSSMQGISEIIKSGKHASLPAKVENGPGGQAPAFATSQEAKRRRRRESHNLVERRRRDNINERIQELSMLVPIHRLEDEKVRKHLNNNSPLSPGLSACSPPRATSMLAGGVGRRASGIPLTTTFTPGDEKDKNPNKGDILNGAVGWTRDLMWALHEKMEQEKELRQLITSLGGVFPFETSEETLRMEAEVEKAIEKNGVRTFAYSRGPGSGLRVPGYTDLSGHPVMNGNNSGSESRLSPGSSGQVQNNGHVITFKEEDEYDMDLN